MGRLDLDGMGGWLILVGETLGGIIGEKEGGAMEEAEFRTEVWKDWVRPEGWSWDLII